MNDFPFVIRPGVIGDLPAIARVYVESWKKTYTGLMPDLFVKGMTEEAALGIFTDSLQPNEFRYFLHVAQTPEGRIVGFSDGGRERSHPEKGAGELYAVYLLAEFQKKGIGRRLLQCSAQSLLQSGMTSMVTWVVDQSPFRKFYESIGGRLEPGVKKLEVAGQEVKLVSYAWNDLRKILEGPGRS